MGDTFPDTENSSKVVPGMPRGGGIEEKVRTSQSRGRWFVQGGGEGGFGEDMLWLPWDEALRKRPMIIGETPWMK